MGTSKNPRVPRQELKMEYSFWILLFYPLFYASAPALILRCRKPFDAILMFKILILKSLHNLSDEETERQIRDRLSFRDFLGLAFSDIVPDAKTIWLFGEQLKEHRLERAVFDRFNEVLDAKGFKAKSGTIVDSSLVEVPKQRHTEEENEQIKSGEIPESLSSNPHVLAQKDTDARWTQKSGVSYFGYKDHVFADEEYKFIRDYAVTDASVHDSVAYLSVLPERVAFWIGIRNLVSNMGRFVGLKCPKVAK